MNAAPLNPVTVFLAEDSAAMRQRLVAMLSGPSVTVVGQGETPQGCIDGILASDPDVVVLDVRLDGGPGLDVLKAFRQAERPAAFVVFSNNAGPGYRKRYLAEGASAFLDKCGDFDQLARAVAAFASPCVH